MMGPATTGKPPKVPAISEPHFLPARVINKINNGTVKNLNKSKVVFIIRLYLVNNNLFSFESRFE